MATPPPPRPLVPPAPSTSYRRPSIRQRRPFSRKSQLRPLSHPHPHPLRYSSIPEGPSFNYRMTVASADQLQVQAQLAQQQAGPGPRRRPSVLRRSKQAPKRPPSYPLPTTQSPCLHTVTSGVVLNDLGSCSPPQSRNAPGAPGGEPIGGSSAAKKRERRRTLSKVCSLFVNLVQRRPSVETYAEEPINLDSPELLGAPLRPHRSPDAASFIVSSKIMDTELKPTRSSSPQRLSVQTIQSARSARSAHRSSTGHSLVGGILPSFRRRSLLRERLVSHFSTDSSDDETDDETATSRRTSARSARASARNSARNSARASARASARGPHLTDIKMEDALPVKEKLEQPDKPECGSVLFGRRFSMPVPRIKSMPEIVRPLRRLSFQPRGHSLDRIAF